MAHTDPTLATPFVEALDATLVARIKSEQDSSALTTLVERHSGIYNRVINSYAATYPHVIRRAEMNDDKMFNFYNFILAYDPARGTKLSSYIWDRTDYLCKSLLRADKRDALSLGYYSASGCKEGGASQTTSPEDSYSTTNGGHVALIDESRASQVVEIANNDLALADIRSAAMEICTDKRFFDILEYRHFSAPKCALSWREIGQRMGLSYERCREIYNENIERIKSHLNTVTI